MKKWKTLLRFLRYDCRNGLLQKWKIYIVSVLVSMIAVSYTNGLLKGNSPAFTDYYLYLFTGMPRFYPSQAGEFFQIPVFWLGIMIIPTFMVGYYAVNDLDGYGLQLIMKSRSRKTWWVSKCIWCFLQILLYVISLLFSIALYCVATGRNIFHPAYVWHFKMGLMHVLDMFTILTHGILLPVVTLFTLCMVQMLLSVVAGELAAYVGIISYITLCAYVTHPLFIANYTMLYRDSLLMPDGISFDRGFLINGVICLAVFIAGLVVIQKKSLLRYEIRNR